MIQPRPFARFPTSCLSGNSRNFRLTSHRRRTGPAGFRRPLFSAIAALPALSGLTVLPVPAEAHFLEVLPSLPVVNEKTGGRETIDITFTHPMEGGPVMEMARPQKIAVVVDGKETDLTAQAHPVQRQGKTAWQARHDISAPGDYIFYVIPAPYHEPAEGRLITHYSKVVVDAFGAGNGWQRPVGLPVEILPLTRPYGLWSGSLFQGQVLREGKPVPGASVEFEYKGDGAIELPDETFATGVTTADSNGVFSLTLPRGGWWGMAALTEGPVVKTGDGKSLDSELGGLLWVYTRDMQPRETSPAVGPGAGPAAGKPSGSGH